MELASLAEEAIRNGYQGVVMDVNARPELVLPIFPSPITLPFNNGFLECNK